MTNLDLAVIGNCSYGALIDQLGRVIWACFPHFDRGNILRALRAVTIPAIAVALTACNPLVPLSQARYDRLLDSEEIEVIDATLMSRTELERALGEHQMLGRVHYQLRSGNRRQGDFDKALAKGLEAARRSGGNVILHTEDSQLVATIMQDVRYAAPEGTLVIYIMRKLVGEPR